MPFPGSTDELRVKQLPRPDGAHFLGPSPAGGQLGCFRGLAIRDEAAANICPQALTWP